MTLMKPSIVDSILIDYNIGHALSELKHRMADLSISEGREQLESVESDYKLMLDSYKHGFKDPQGQNVFDALLRRVYAVYCSIRLTSVIKSRSVFSRAFVMSKDFTIENEEVIGSLEQYIQDIAMASLLSEPEQATTIKKVNAVHQRLMETLFNSILVSKTWTDETTKRIHALLLSPTIDQNDSLLIVSAITLSLLVVFDVNKWLLLYHVYLDSKSIPMTQRALVGLYFTAQDNVCNVYPEIKMAYDCLCSTDKSVKDIIELQIQLFYCVKTEADSKEIQRDIIPTLIKNNRFDISSNKIVEKEEDSLDDILNNDKTNSSLAELEEKMDRMNEMLKNGSDVYFSGFSQMKRFSFFYQISNWFIPFNLNHPDIADISTNEMLTIIANTVAKSPFCDSDKYSFAFGISSVFNSLPDNIKELLVNNRGLIVSASEGMDMSSPVFQRRMYLQNLYRFFMLYQDRKDFPNPFLSHSLSNTIMKTLAGKKHEGNIGSFFLELIRFYFKNKRYEAVINICSERYEKGLASVDEMILLGYSYLNEDSFDKAYDIFAYVNMLKTDNLNVLNGFAKSAFCLHKYDESAELYNTLISLDGTKKKYVIYKCVSLINHDRVKDGLSELYRLDYEDATDSNVKRAIAWGCLMDTNPSEADKIYAMLIDKADDISWQDYLNAGYAKLLLSKNQEAVTMFKKCLKMRSSDNDWSLASAFSSDSRMLACNNVKDYEIRLMLDIVGDDCH